MNSRKITQQSQSPYKHESHWQQFKTQKMQKTEGMGKEQTLNKKSWQKLGQWKQKASGRCKSQEGLLNKFYL